MFNGVSVAAKVMNNTLDDNRSSYTNNLIWLKQPFTRRQDSTLAWRSTIIVTTTNLWNVCCGPHVLAVIYINLQNCAMNSKILSCQFLQTKIFWGRKYRSAVSKTYFQGKIKVCHRRHFEMMMKIQKLIQFFKETIQCSKTLIKY